MGLFDALIDMAEIGVNIAGDVIDGAIDVIDDLFD